MSQVEKYYLRDYQIEAVKMALMSRGYAYFLDMGFGKTIISLVAVKYLKKYGKIKKRVLVVSKPTICNAVWPEEVENPHWQHIIGGLTIEAATGDARKRNRILFDGKSDIVTLSADSLRTFATELKKRGVSAGDLFDMLIVDESSLFKNNTAGRTKAMLNDIAPYIDRRIILTGTPSPNGYTQIWSQIKIVDGGRRLGTEFNDFKFRFLKEKIVGRQTTKYGVKKDITRFEVDENMVGEIKNLISDVVFSLDDQKYVDIPDFSTNFIKLDWNNKGLEEQYKIFEEQFILSAEYAQKLRDAKSDEERERLKQQYMEDIGLGGEDAAKSGNIVAKTKASLQVKLLQFCSGAVYKDQKKELDPTDPEGLRVIITNKDEYETIHDIKIKAIKDITDTIEDETFVIFYSFKHEAERLIKALGKGAEMLEKNQSKRPEQIRRWNNGEIKYFILHPASAGHGLNLQHGGHNMIWMTLNWDLELYMQAVKRLHRPGQKKPVNNYILTLGEVEEKVARSLAEKRAVQDDLIAHMQRNTEKRMSI